MMKAMDTKDRRVQAQYLVDGVVVTMCKPGRVRKGERTWVGGSKYTVAGLGAKAVALRNQGLVRAKG